MVEPSGKRLTLRKRKGDSSESLVSVEDAIMRQSQSYSHTKKLRLGESSIGTNIVDYRHKNLSAED